MEVSGYHGYVIFVQEKKEIHTVLEQREGEKMVTRFLGELLL